MANPDSRFRWRYGTHRWLDDAILNLAEDEDLDADDASVTDAGLRDGAHMVSFAAYMVSFGGDYSPKYLVCEDYDEAERLAVARVEQDLEHEPGFFDQDWLMGHFTISDTDIRLIANEQGDSYAEDLDDERAIEEADMEDELEELNDEWGDHENRIDEIEDELLDAIADEDEEAEERLEAEKSGAEKRMAELEKEKEQTIDEAREKVASDYALTIFAKLLDDPLGYFRDHFGWTAEEVLQNNIGRLDYDAAAQDAVDTDGVGHFLSSYDGDQLDLDDGAVAFRTN